MRRADRLFQIVQHLRGGRLVTAQKLGTWLEVSERTIYRDIADLQSTGVPIDGEAGVGYMTALPLEKARQIIDAAFAKGAVLKLRPLGVSVLDAGGHLVAFERQDGASFLRPQMSAGKAYGALAIGMTSKT